MIADEIAVAVGSAAAEEMSKALERMKHCLAQLNDAQIWWRPQPSLNSIGNVILHLCGNLRQWVVAGLGGAADNRNRPTEFSERGPITRDELYRQLDAAVEESRAVLARQTSAQLLAARCIQGFDVTGLGAIFDSVPHFRGHTQEIVHRTRLLLGERYQFQWQPSSPEQGAPA